IADGANGEGDQDGEYAGGLALFDEVAQIAIEAEARALQHEAEGGACKERKAQGAAFGTAGGGKREGGADDAGNDQCGDGEAGNERHVTRSSNRRTGAEAPVPRGLPTGVAAALNSDIAPHGTGRIVNRHTDRIAIFGPRTVIVADFVAEDARQHKPGVAR